MLVFEEGEVSVLEAEAVGGEVVLDGAECAFAGELVHRGSRQSASRADGGQQRGVARWGDARARLRAGVSARDGHYSRRRDGWNISIGSMVTAPSHTTARLPDRVSR